MKGILIMTGMWISRTLLESVRIMGCHCRLDRQRRPNLSRT